MKGRGRKKVEKKKPGEDLNLNLDINGENTLGMDNGIGNLKLKLCLTPRLREDCLEESIVVKMMDMEKTNLNQDEKTILASLEERRAVQIGRKIYEKDGQKERKLEEETIEERRKTLCLKFAQKCLTNEKNQQMFPLSKKIHSMETRKPEEFEVQYAKTDRLKNCAKIYMQNLLNGG